MVGKGSQGKQNGSQGKGSFVVQTGIPSKKQKPQKQLPQCFGEIDNKVPGILRNILW